MSERFGPDSDQSAAAIRDVCLMMLSLYMQYLHILFDHMGPSRWDLFKGIMDTVL